MAGSLGILIPPSISLILYSLVTGASVGKLFLAGILPGLMLALLFAAYTVVRTAGGAMVRPRSGPARGRSVETGSDLPPMTLGMIGSLAMIVVVLGSIYAGLATPTEAAAIGVAYALILTSRQTHARRCDCSGWPR